MKPIFADTSYYVALLSDADAHHELAVRWSEQHLGRMVVTEYVIVELGSALSTARHRHLFVPFVNHLLKDPSTLLVPPSPSLLSKASTYSPSAGTRSGPWSIAYPSWS